MSHVISSRGERTLAAGATSGNVSVVASYSGALTAPDGRERRI